MNHILKILLLIVLFLGNHFFCFSDVKKSQTFYGDCSSSDKSKQYKSKTYIDVDKDGKWDHMRIVLCNNKARTAKADKQIFVDNGYDFPYGNDISFESNIIFGTNEDFLLRHNSGFTLGIEKHYDDTTYKVYSFILDSTKHKYIDDTVNQNLLINSAYSIYTYDSLLFLQVYNVSPQSNWLVQIYDNSNNSLVYWENQSLNNTNIGWDLLHEINVNLQTTKGSSYTIVLTDYTNQKTLLSTLSF